MKFWDTSALLPLFVAQVATKEVRQLYAADSDLLAWTLTEVEVASSLARLTRAGELEPRPAARALADFDRLWRAAQHVVTIEAVKIRARRLLQVHTLAAADALQLGAALIAAHDDPRGRAFVCLDQQLSAAARREGFPVLPE